MTPHDKHSKQHRADPGNAQAAGASGSTGPARQGKVAMQVASVSADAPHAFSKPVRTRIELLAGLGVAGDAHCGATVQHRSRVARNPNQPNLRQVHLIHRELLDELASAGFDVHPGDLGENILTEGIALLDLPAGTRLHVGATALVEVTGLRNPCAQIDRFRKGLLPAVLGRDADGGVVRKTGVMGIVLAGGLVQRGDAIRIELPALPHARLACV